MAPPHFQLPQPALPLPPRDDKYPYKPPANRHPSLLPGAFHTFHQQLGMCNGPQPGLPPHGDTNILLGKGQFNYPIFCFVTAQERAAQTPKVLREQMASCTAMVMLPGASRSRVLDSRISVAAKRGRKRQEHGNNRVKAKPQTSRFLTAQRSKKNVVVVQLQCFL